MTKYFLYLFAIVKARLLRQRVPILVTLCVTNRCNMHCLYCYVDNYVTKREELPKEKILSLIDELAAMGTRYISINGGEALLRDDLEEIVDKILAKKMLCHLSTNGILIPRRLSLLRKIDSLAVSLDGIGAPNDLNRGKGTYQTIREGLEILRREKIKFHTHTVITKNNKDAIPEILALAREFHFRAQFSLLRVEDSPDKEIALKDDELKAVVVKLLQYKREGQPVFFSHQAYESYLHWPFPGDRQVIFNSLPAGFRPIPCYIKRFSCHIEPDGRVYPCVVLVNKMKVKNFLEVGFAECFESLKDNPCLACHNICCNDLNLIFSLSQSSILNAIRVVRERIAKNHQ